MKKVRKMFEKFNEGMLKAVANEKGQTMIEYALVAVLIAIALVIIFTQGGVSSGISTAASKVSSALQ